MKMTKKDKAQLLVEYKKLNDQINAMTKELKERKKIVKAILQAGQFDSKEVTAFLKVQNRSTLDQSLIPSDDLPLYKVEKEIEIININLK